MSIEMKTWGICVLCTLLVGSPLVQSDQSEQGKSSSGVCEVVGQGNARISGNPWEAIMNLAKIAESNGEDPPGITRILYSEVDIRARKFVKQMMRDAGLNVHEDAIGNVFGRWEGSDDSLRFQAVATGSHIDAIPQSGRFDGTLGVIGAIHAVSQLKEKGYQPKRPIEVIMFTAEEPTRFGIGCLGSRVLARAITQDRLSSLRDESGRNFSQVAAAALSFRKQNDEAGFAGAIPESANAEAIIDGVRKAEDAFSYFVELHIEQGPILEEEGLDIGIVKAIAAPAAASLVFECKGGHAGARLMPGRSDAGLAAAEFIVEVERVVLAHGGIDTVGTVGQLSIEPGATNSIPRKAKLSLDLRDINGTRRDLILDRLTTAAAGIAERRKCSSSLQLIAQDPPVACSEDLVKLGQRASTDKQLKCKVLVSRAYHDSSFMALRVPTTMIFIPCYKGYSHRPEEFASPKSVENGVQVLADMLKSLSEA